MTTRKTPVKKPSATKAKKVAEGSAEAMGLDENHPAVKSGVIKNPGNHLPEDQDDEKES